MSGQAKGMKRARTQEQQDDADSDTKQPGRDQLLLSSLDLQTRLGRKFVDEAELLPLLLAHGLVRRVRTIQIHVRPLGGDSFKVTLEASKPTVGEAKVAIARSQGTAEEKQELYRVAERADGSAVREDDAEPEPLEDESMELEDGDVLAMAVKVEGYTLGAWRNKPNTDRLGNPSAGVSEITGTMCTLDEACRHQVHRSIAQYKACYLIISHTFVRFLAYPLPCLSI
jgi:hypothetical protein